MAAADSSDGENQSGAVPAYPGVGFRIGEYLIKDTLGHGSMATVFLADDGTGHDVALKIFQEGPGVSPTMLERFRREAEATKKLRRHPNIMKVYATGKHGPWHYIVMEPIRNSRTLEDALEMTQLTIEEIVRLAIKIARALHYAHSRNIIHRDVKPANIMVDEFGEPKLSDFGVADLADMPGVTVTGALTGTPLYMSPEQARAEKTGPSSDIYSLGVVLYEALTGVLPYSTQHAAPVRSVLDAVRNEIPKRPRVHRREISRDLEAVILKSIAKDPSRRYRDADDFADDLERALTGRRVTARLFSYWELVITLARRYDQFFVAAVMMVLMAGLAGWFFYQQLLRERYEKLFSIIHYRNIEATKTAEKNDADGPQRSAARMWQEELRLARRNRDGRNITEARNALNRIIGECKPAGDLRTIAMANLELARCDALVPDFKAAVERYRETLLNPDAPKTEMVAEKAYIEALIISIWQHDLKQALEILNLRKMPEDGSLAEIVRCLSGDITPAKLLELTDAMPARYRSEAHLAAAVRFRLNGEDTEFQAALDRCRQSAQPAGEWPSALAQVFKTQAGK